MSSLSLGARREVGRLGKATFRMSTEVKTEVPDVLKSILARKEDEVAALKAEVCSIEQNFPQSFNVGSLKVDLCSFGIGRCSWTRASDCQTSCGSQ